MRTKATSQARRSDLLLALPADAYGFRRAGSTESTETVRPGKLDLLPYSVLESIAQAEDLMAQSVYGIHSTAMSDNDNDDEEFKFDTPTRMTEAETTTTPEDRLPTLSPKKTPPTPPRCGDEVYEVVVNLVPPSAVQQPRFVTVTSRGSSPFVLKPRRSSKQASIFRASPRMDRVGPPTRQHGGFYALRRSPAFDEDFRSGGGGDQSVVVVVPSSASC